MGHHKVRRELDAAAFTLPDGHLWRKLPLICGIVGLVGLGGAFAVGMGHEGFYHSYLVAFMYFLSLALGSLFFVLIQFAARAGWSVVVRRFAEAAAGTLPVFALLFVPVLLGMHDLYHHWLDHEAVATDKILQAKSPYLNTSFFLGRAVVYFLLWSAMGLFFFRTSTRQDKEGGVALTAKMQARSYPGILLFALSVTFAAIDWIKSMDPHWYSTMWGVYFFAGSIVSTFALLALFAVRLNASGAVEKVITTEHQHDLGKLTFGFTVFWTYIAFSQYFLIWYANIPEETLFFVHRGHGPDGDPSWFAWSAALALGHFIIPFFFLMPRTIKRNPLTLQIGAAWMLVMHFVDLQWQIMPMVHHSVHFGLVDVLAMLGVGGIFFAAFFALLTRHPVVPVRDPRLRESLAFQNF